MKKHTLLATGVSVLAALQAFAAEPAKGKTEAQPKGQPSQEELQRMIAEAMANQKKQPELPKITLEEAKIYFSRNIGINIGSQLKQDKLINQEEFLKGLNDALAGKAKAEDIDEAKMRQADGMLQEIRNKEMEAEREAQMKEIREKSEAFIAENKGKEGVKTTKSGLQYKVLKAGEGVAPTPKDKVEVHYTGKLIDGTVFDSSVQRGEPITFGVTQVIPGWVEGLQLMKPGAKYEFFIPWNLGYGERGSGRAIPPYAALVFEVELLKVIEPEPASEEAPKEAPAEAKPEEKK